MAQNRGPMKQPIHPAAEVHPEAVLGRGVVIGPYAVVGAGGHAGRRHPHRSPMRSSSEMPFSGRGPATSESGAVIGGDPQGPAIPGRAYPGGDRGGHPDSRVRHDQPGGAPPPAGPSSGGAATLMAYVHVGHDCVVEDGRDYRQRRSSSVVTYTSSRTWGSADRARVHQPGSNRDLCLCRRWIPCPEGRAALCQGLGRSGPTLRRQFRGAEAGQGSMPRARPGPQAGRFRLLFNSDLNHLRGDRSPSAERSRFARDSENWSTSSPVQSGACWYERRCRILSPHLCLRR